MRTREEINAELQKCRAEIEKTRREEDRLLPSSPDLSGTDKLPPINITREMLARFYEIHDRQLALLNKRTEILDELRELYEHEEANAPKAVEKPKSAQDKAMEKLLAHTTQQARELLLGLHDTILKLDGVEAVPWQWWIDYKKKGVTFLTMVTPDFERNGLGLFIRAGSRQIEDPQGWTKKVPVPGELNTTFQFRSIDDLDYAMSLIRQAHSYA